MRSKLLLVLVLLVSVLLLCAACAGDTPPEDNNVDNETGNNEALPELSVGVAGVDIKIATIIVAQELGYYTEEGVKVNLETVSNLSEGITAVDLGKLDILPFGVIPSANFIAQGADIIIFGGTISEGSEIIALPENEGTINSLEDLRGKTIGCYWMETGHMMLKAALSEAGIEAEFIRLDGQPTIIEAVRKGEVDYGILNSGQGYVALQSGLIVEAHISEFSPGFPCCRQSTSRATLESKRDAFVSFETANLRAYQTILADKDTTIAALTAYSGQGADYVEAVIYGLEGVYDTPMIISLDPNKNKVIEFYQVMQDNGDIEVENPPAIDEQIDITIYADALTRLMEREPDNQLWEQLNAEFIANNY